VQKPLSPVKVVPYRLEITVAAGRDGRFEQLGPVAPDFGIGAGGQGPVDVFAEVDELVSPAVGPDYPEVSVKGHDSGANRFDYGVGQVGGTGRLRCRVLLSLMLSFCRFIRLFLVLRAHLQSFNSDNQVLSSARVAKKQHFCFLFGIKGGALKQT